MHGWRFPIMRARLAEIARDVGFTQISVGHEVAPLIKLIGRGDTTVVDAYLSPVLRRYVDRVAAGLPLATDLHFMQSNGGLAEATAFRGKDAILSGPAGGVVGMVAASAPHGNERLIGFDMGGTSTDVSHYAGQFELADESVVAGVRIRAPMMQIHTVAAGGGSICRFDGMRFRVGPGKRGRKPGPGLLPQRRSTDGHRLQPVSRPDRPRTFSRRIRAKRRPGARSEAARARLQQVADQLGGAKSLEEIARGFLDIAVDNMAAAIRKISIARGHDVTRYTLACFGGAGGQHACAVADALGMERILIHPLAGVLSAYGIGIADMKAIREASWLKPLSEDFSASLSDLEGRARDALIEQGLNGERIELLRRARLRTAGSDTTLEIAIASSGQMHADFSTLHKHALAIGKTMPRSLSIRWSLKQSGRSTAPSRAGPKTCRMPVRRLRARADFRADFDVVVEEGWRADRAGDGTLVLTRAIASTGQRRSAPTSIPCGWRSSTICSWRSPRKWALRCRPRRPASTSRNGSIFRARSSIPKAR